MATKIVCDRCKEDCQDFETYKFNYALQKIVTNEAIGPDAREIDLCGYCANQFREFLKEPARIGVARKQP